MATPRKTTGSLLLRTTASLSMLFVLGFAESEVERPIYEMGETGVLVVRNRSRLPMAIGGCNPTSYQERLPGRWVPDPFIRPACVFTASPDGRHTLEHYQLIRPGGSVIIPIPTDWVGETPAIIRVIQRVSVACERRKRSTRPLNCRGFETITTDPVVVVEPGTTEVIGRR